MISANTNMGGLRAEWGLQSTHRALQTSLERLSTGLRINRAEDDAAGVMVRDRFQAQVLGLEEGVRNIQTAQGMIQVAEQGINKVTEALQRIRSLAVRAADDNLNDDDRGRIQEQIRGLLKEINERAEATTYNGKRLLDGSISEGRAERQATAKLQSNSILADGHDLIADATVTGDAVNVADAVSQGSYEVKVVRGSGDRSYVSQTSKTVLGGKSSSGLGFLNSGGVAGTVVNRNETVVDREGNRHQVAFVFTSTSASQWTFSLSSSESGAWTSDLATTGTVEFDEYSGQLKSVLVTSGQATSSHSSIKQTLADGTTTGQKWTIDFSRLRNVTHPATIDAPTEPANGTTGATPTTQVTFNCQLDSSAAFGFRTGTLGLSTWVDRTGYEHNVGFVFTKLEDAAGLADVWEMEIVGLDAGAGAWTGPNVNDGPIRVTFSSSGALVDVNGNSSTDLTVFVGDSTDQPQPVVIHMANLTSGTTPSPSGLNHISASTDGSSTLQTTTVTYTGLLDRDNPSTLVPPYSYTASSGSWIDRLGYTHDTTTTFTKSGTNQWDYSISGLDAGHAWTGLTNGRETGTVFYDDDGNLLNVTSQSQSYGTSPVLLKMGDGTVDADGDPLGVGAAQDVYLDFTRIVQPTNGGPGDTVVDPPVANGTAQAPGLTTTATYAAVLDSTVAVGAAYNTDLTWYDRNGTQHTVNVVLRKEADATGEGDLGDQWSYTITGLDTTGTAGSGAAGVAWNNLLSGSATGTFTYGLDGNTTQTVPLVIDDGTNGGQAVSVQFVNSQNLHPVVAVSGTQDGTATPPLPTTEAQFTGVLDKDLLVGSNPSFTTQDVTWYDRLGQGHAVSMTFEKVAVNQWSYSVNGIQPGARDGAWTGASYHDNASGTLTFDDAGTLLSVKNALGATIATTGGEFDITVADDVIATDQAVHIDLRTMSVGGVTQSGKTGITQPGNGVTTDSTVSAPASTVQDGSNPPPGITTATSYTGSLDGAAATGASTTANLTWYDRDGIAHDVLLTLTKTTPEGTGNSGLADAWTYSLSSATAGVWAGGLSQSGTLSFNSLGVTSNIAVNVADGTAGGQAVAVNLSGLLVRNATAIPSGTQNGQADPPDPTTATSFSGVLDKDLTAGNAVTSSSVNWVDRAGTNHSVNVRFVKQSSPPANTWTYSFQGLTSATGAWHGSVLSGPNTGTVTFDDAGNLTAVNGSGTFTFDLRLRDDTYHSTLNPSGGQTVNASFAGLTQPTNASTAQSTVSQTTNSTINGSATPPGITTTSSYTGVIDASALSASTVSKNLTWQDRNGAAHTVTMTLTKATDATGSTGLADTWDYTFTGLTGTGTDADGATWSGALSGSAGSITFNSDGTLPATAFNVVIDDGTTAGQTVGVTLTALRNLFPIAAPSGTQDGTATAPDPTTLVKYTGVLDKDLAAVPASTFTTQASTWYDRLGTAHSTSVTFTKTATNTWSYSVSGLTTAAGAWTGAAAGGNATGYLTFNDDGTLRNVNGTSTGSYWLVPVTVGDDVIGSDQAITLDFGTGSVAGVTESGRTGVTQPGNGATGDSTVSALAGSDIDGDATFPGFTQNASVSALLDSTAAVGDSTSSVLTWYDRNGVSHDVTLTLSKTADTTGASGLQDTWTYTFAPDGAGVWAGTPSRTGTLSFGTDGKVSSPLSIVVNDGTSGNQTVTVDVTGLRVRNPLQALGGSQDVVTPVAPNPTTAAGFAGYLDADLNVGTVETSASRQWFDRLGFGHNVSISFTKTAANSWSYSINGLGDTTGPWTGGAATNGTGTLTFDASGALIAVNGSSAGSFKQVTVTVADDAGGQQVVVDFGAALNGNTGITQPADAADSTVSQVANSSADGSATPPSVTASSTYSGVLDAAAGAGPVSTNVTWYDRNGEAHTIGLTLTKTSNGTDDAGLDDAWSYSFSGFTTTGGGSHGVTWTGLTAGSATGTLDFGTNGALVSPTSLSFTVGDGTAAGQTVSVALSGLISRSTITAPSGTQNVTTPTNPNPTTTAKYGGVLDGDQNTTTAYTTPNESWFDRLGGAHNVSITYTKTAANTWTYSLNGLTTAGGTWTGAAASANASGTITFDETTGAITSVKDSLNNAIGTAFTVTVADDAGGQGVLVDFASLGYTLTQAIDGTDSTVANAGSSSVDGTASVPAVTSSATYSAVLDAGASPAPQSKDLTWYDRNGAAHTVTLTFNKSSNGTGDAGLDDQWTYTFSGLSSTGSGAHGVAWGGLQSGSLTGTLDFNADGSLASPTSLALVISDGTAAGQSVSVGLSGIITRSTIAAPSGTQNVTTPVSPNPTTTAKYAGVLDGDQNVGTTYTTPDESWFDRLGGAHDVSITYSKTAEHEWAYTVNGLTTAAGRWTGAAPTGSTTGTLTFDAAGALIAVNGSSASGFKQVAITVADDAGGQAVTLDFGATVNGNAGLTEAIDGTNSTVQNAGTSSVDGTGLAPAVTSTATYSAVLDAGAGATPQSKDLTWYDRNGAAHTVTLTFNKSVNGTGDSGLDDQWTYTFSAFDTTGAGDHGVTWGGLSSGSLTGTLDFNADGSLASPTSVALVIADGTAAGQSVSVSLSGVITRSAVAGPSGTQNVTTPVSPNPTTTAKYAGVLDGDQNVGTTYTTPDESWFDRLGGSHNVSITYTKTAANEWAYTLNGLTTAAGRWTGAAPTGNVTGTLTFDGTGALVAVNGSSASGFKQVAITVADDAGGQAVTVDFGATVNGNAGLTQAIDGTDSTVAVPGNSTSDGTALVPAVTSTASYSGVLDAAAGAAPVTKDLTWYDRNGASHTVTLSLTKASNGTGDAGLDDSWSYSFTGFSTTGGGAHGVAWTGLASGAASGTLDFDSTGALVSPTSIAFVVNDGTAGGQSVNVSLAGLVSRSPIAAPSGTQDVTTVVHANPTTSAKYAGVLDGDLAVGSTRTTATETWYDRLGGSHGTSVSFTKTGANAWSYTVNGLTAGGTWTGGATGNVTGTMTFDASGNMLTLNSVDVSSDATLRKVSLGVADDAGGQTVVVDFGSTVNGNAGIGQATDAADSTVADAGNTTITPPSGTTPDPTTTETFSARLGEDAELGSTASQVIKWYDRLGASHDVTLALTKTAADRWSYSLTGLAAVTGAWEGLTSGQTAGSLVFTGGVLTDVLDDMDVSVGTGALSFVIDDGTVASQTVSVAFTGIATVAGTQDGSATAPTPTTQSTYSGNLDANRGVGYSVSTGTHQWFDRLGTGHDVNVTFTKTAANTWSYSVSGLPGSGGAWDGGAAPAGSTGTIVFDGSGNVSTVNGIAGNTVGITVADDTTSDQPLTLSFASLTQTVSGTNVLDATAILTGQDGSTATPGKTTSASFGGNLSAAAGTYASSDSEAERTFTTTFYDKTGTAHNDVTLTLRKSTENAGSLADTWSYTIAAGAAGVWTAGINQTGTLTFDGTTGEVSTIDGNPAAAIALSVVDGTGTTQSISVSLHGASGLKSVAVVALSGAESGGSVTAAETTTATFTGTLDADSATGKTVDAASQWFDSNGVAHTVTTRFTKQAAADTWAYTVLGLDGTATGGTWAGNPATGNTSGTLTFTGSALNDPGALSVTVDDGGSGQPINLAFSLLGLTQPSNSIADDANAVTATPDGGDRHSTAASFSGELDADAAGSDVGATRTVNATWYDRSGTAQTVTLSLTKPTETAGRGDTWNYTMSAPAGAMWSAFSTTGTLAFNATTGAIETVTVGTGSASVTGTTLSQTVTDTAGSYGVDVTFTSLTSVSVTPTDSVSGSQTGGSATASDPTATAEYGGQLDANRTIGSSLTKSLTWYDRIGEAHNVDVLFTRTAIDAWSYEIQVPAAAGAWDGSIADGTGAVSGTLSFNATTGALSQVNGAAPGTFTVVVGDTTTGQTVAIDFTAAGSTGALSQATNGTSSASAAITPLTSNGPDPTTTEGFVGRLDGGAPVGATSTQTVKWYDRLGTSHDVTLALSKTQDNAGQGDRWSFSIQGLTTAASAWTGSVTGTTSGTLVFDGGGALTDILNGGGSSLGLGALSLNVADGSTGGQPVSVTFTGFASVADTQNGSAVVPTPTTDAHYEGILDGDLAVGTAITSDVTGQWFDRLGTSHGVYVTYTKTAENAWSYSINGLPGSGGAWNGVSAPANTSGTLTFNASGALTAVNGVNGATSTSVTVADDTDGEQPVTVSFLGLTQPTDGPSDDTTITSADNTTINGSNASPSITHLATYSAHLDAATAVNGEVTTALDWYDRNGDVHSVTLRLAKDSDGGTALEDTWRYTLEGLSSTGSGGVVWSGAANSTGTLTFDADGNVATVNGVSTRTLSLLVNDGTTGKQSVTVNFDDVRNDAAAAALNGTQSVAAPQASDQTDQADYNGLLDADLAVGATLTTDPKTWYDRQGVGHTVSVTFTKEATDRWGFSISGLTAGGAWTGGATGATTGTLHFSGSSLTDIRDASDVSLGIGSPFSIQVNDGTTSGQGVSIDFLSITQPANGPLDDTTASSVSNTDINGSNTAPTLTTTASYSAHLDAAAALNAEATTSFSWYDRKGIGHSVTLRLAKDSDGGSALADTWRYTLEGLTSTPVGGAAWTGAAGSTGTLTFDANGNVATVNGVSTRTLSLVIGDGTTAGQPVTVSFDDVRNDGLTLADLAGTQSVAVPQASDQSDAADFNGLLDADLAVGATLTTDPKTWYDRLGNGHTVSVTYTKQATDRWGFSINGLAAGGAWTGSSSGATTGTLHFSGTTLTDIKNASDVSLGITTPFAIVLGDGTTAGQSVTIDFRDVTQPANGPVDDTTASSASNTDINGSNAAPTLTTTASYSAHLDAAAALNAEQTTSFSWYDRQGIGHSVTLRLAKDSDGGTALEDTWRYTLEGLTSTPVGGAAWTGAAGSTGTLTFDASGNVATVNGVSTRTLSLVIGDGTTAGQGVTVSFDDVRNDGLTLSDLTGTQSVVTPSASDQSDLADFNGLLDADLAVGSTLTTANKTWYDRQGNGHTVSVTFTKQVDDRWGFSINGLTAGGAWTGGASGATTGTLHFSGGALTDIRNASDVSLGIGAPFTIAVNDGTTGGQSMGIDFLGITQPGNGLTDDTTASSASSTDINGDSTAPAITTTASYSAHLDAAAATNDFVTSSFSWYDRHGDAHSVTLRLSKASDGGTALADTWNYTFQGLDTTGAGGVAWTAPGNSTGTITFDADGNVSLVNASSTRSLSLLIGDGTTAGQTVTVSFNALRNDAVTPVAVAGTQNVSPQQASDQTDTADYNGFLDADLAVGSTLTTATTQWFDRLGGSHNVTVTFTKQVDDRWGFSINGLTAGSAWTGGASGATTGTLHFSGGALTDIRDASDVSLGIITPFTILVNDGTTGKQAVTIDFLGITQPGNGATDDSTVSVTDNSSANGTNAQPTITSTATYTAHLDSTVATGATQSTSFTWYDRKAGARTVTLDLNKSTNPADLPDSWTYTVSGLTGTLDGVTWSGATNSTGTLTFNAAGNPTPSSVTLNISDGTTDGQNVTLLLSGVQNDGAPDSTLATATLEALSDTQDGTATAPVPTLSAVYDGDLDGDLAVGATLTTDRTAPDSRWFDRLGTAHDVYVTYRKLDTNSWAYTLNGLTTAGGAWTGAGPGGSTTGTLTFNDAGNLTAINGGAVAAFSITAADDVTATDQSVLIDFTGVRQPASGTPSTDTTIDAAGATVSNGSATAPGYTRNVSYAAHLDHALAAGTTRSTNFSWYDRNGDAHDVTLTLTKQSPDNALDDSWAYSFSGLSTTGSGGVVWSGSANSTGTLTFDSAGNLTSPLTVVLNIADGTSGGHALTVDFSAIKNDAAASSPLTGTANGTGVAPGTTSTAQYQGNLDGDLSVGSSQTTAIKPWYDRLGVGHDVSITYNKVNTNSWTYTLNGLTDVSSAWDGAASPSGNVTGTLTFNDAGTLIAVNGNTASSQGPTGNYRTFDVTVSDDTVPNQTVRVNFTGLTQTMSFSPNGNSSVTQTGDGNAAVVVGGLNTNPGVTSTATYDAHLNVDAAASTVSAGTFQWFDRKGVAHDVTLQLTKQTNNSGLNDVWAYTWLGLDSDSTGAGGVNWNNATSGGSGTITFSTSGNPSPTSVSVTINDGTYLSSGAVKGQTVTVSLTNVRNDAVDDTTASSATVVAVSGSQNVPTPVPGPNANAPDRTQNVAYSGLLDADLAVGATLTTDTGARWYDRLGIQHAVSLTFTKTDTNAWSYSFNGLTTAGGAWTGGATTGNVTGTLTFDENGTLTSVNGGPVAAFNITVADDVTASDQQVTIDFAGLAQPGNGFTGDTTVDDAGASVQLGGVAATVSGGLQYNPGMTATATYDGHLNANGGVGTSTSTSFSWYDRDGVAHDVTMTLTKTVANASVDETWGYSLTAATAGVWTAGLAASGTVVFASNGSVASVNAVAGRTGTVNIGDGTLDGQTVALDFTTLRNDAANASALSGSQNGTPVAPNPTLNAAYTAVLDAEDPVGYTTPGGTGAATWYDRRGIAHSTSITFEKTFTNEWTYTLNGLDTAAGAWTGGAPSANYTGTLTFNDAGVMIARDGLATDAETGDFRRFYVTIADDVNNTDQATSGAGLASSQRVLIDFTSIIQEADATVDQTDVDGTPDGTPFSNTNHVVFHSRIVSGQGPVSFPVSNIVDRTGMNSVPGAQVNFYQIRDTNQWQYNVVAPTTSGFSGRVSNGSGVVTFNDAGNLVNGGSFTANFDDGSAEGQDITFVLSALKMSHESDLDGSRTDGVAYSAAALNAEVYFSGSEDEGPVMILEDVGVAARTASLGGIRFTVNRVSQDDVGLTSYIKVLGYEKAELARNALQFQFGADEGNTLHLGLSRMDVTSVFRTSAQYDYTDITLTSALDAQDLIGQVDDAIDYVSGENLKAGQFANHLQRVLDVTRAHSTSMTNALANINDADMALEAMKQSRRAILVQSGTAMVAQANSQNQFLLQLLR